jgi:hypothetical protein
VSETTADWIFKIGSAMGGIMAVFGGIVARELYARISRLETSHDAIIAAIASSNKELTQKMHDQQIKLIDMVEGLKDMARTTFHTKDEHRYMTSQIHGKIDAMSKQIGNRLDAISIGMINK